MVPLKIDNNDISFAEEHFNLTFNEEQKAVIRCLESVDVHACPGSGKTTTLAAKLLILLKKLPERYNEGICVITHTNVAVEAIKEKIGNKAIRLFSYPNHFGTIQSFADKYLTIPAYRNIYKKPLSQIDDSTYVEVLNSFSLNGTAKRYFNNKSFEIEDLVFNLKDFAISKSILEENPFVSKSTETYKDVKRIKVEVLKLGYLKFEESYSIGMRWLEKHPQLCDFFSLRFSYVFIDEMQDMAPHQVKLLKLALSKNLVIQKIGDNNQAIYSSSSQINPESSWSPVNTLSIQRSCRFSETIAKSVKNVCMFPVELGGRHDIQQISPKLLVYNNHSLKYVKDRFARIILRNNLQNCGNGIFKATGFRKSESRLNISSYYQEYQHSATNNKGSLQNLSFYFILRQNQNNGRATTAVSIKNNLLSALCKILRIRHMQHPENGRPFTPFSLWKHIKTGQKECFNSLCRELLVWPLIIDYAELLPKIRDWITTVFLPTYNITLDVDDELNSFINSTEQFPNHSASLDTKVNVYRYRENGEEVAIEFNTIHGVKGETHCATLYLETYTRCYDLEKLMPFFLGETRNTLRSKEIRRLRLGYVAITRPSHLLCLAIHTDRFPNNYATGMEEVGWEIIRL